jgi:hypothetical protein
VILAAVAVVILTIVAVVIVRSTSSETTYTLSAPDQAGGLSMTYGKPAQVFLPAHAGNDLQKILGRRALDSTVALYRSQDGRVFGLDMASGDLADPKHLVSRLRTNPPASGNSNLHLSTTRWTSLAETDPGPHGGKAACGDVAVESHTPPERALICSWQTRHTYGNLVVYAVTQQGQQPMTVDQLADVMRRMRTDLEKPK